MFRLSLYASSVLLIALSASSAEAMQAPNNPTPAQTPAPAASASAPLAPSIVSNPSYRLASGDKIRVTTYGEAALTGEFVVDSSGTVALPLIGNVPAGGKTPQDLQRNIETALSNGYLKEPRVSVEVLTFRPFYILGEVNKPGTYVYSDGLTILNAVATGGGFTYRANKTKVYIKRADSAEEQAFPLTANVPIGPGDTIRIGERFF